MQEIKALTSLRGIFALCVVGYHTRRFYYDVPWPLHRTGTLAVDFFFVLSGFVLAGSYGSKFLAGASTHEYLHFLLRRWCRLFPLHLAILAALVAVSMADGEPLPSRAEVVREITLVHRWAIWHTAPFPMNGPDWSISTEWAANILFPAFVWTTLAGSTQRTMLMLTLSIGMLIVVTSSHGGSLDITESNSALPLMRCFVEFSLGLFAFRYRNAWPALKLDVVLIPLIAMGAAFVLLNVNDIMIVVLMAVLVAGVAGNTGWLSTSLSVRPFYWVGERSYSIYLVHNPIMGLVGVPALALNGAQLTLVLRVLVSLTATLIVSSLTYRWVEIPARKWVRRGAAIITVHQPIGVPSALVD